jgi:transcription initiation factor IIE alpha subunit
LFALGCPVCGEQLERSAEGAKQSESSDSTNEITNNKKQTTQQQEKIK